MTEEVFCKKGKCEYRDNLVNEEWKEDCTNCELDEQIEHELSRKSKRN